MQMISSSSQFCSQVQEAHGRLFKEFTWVHIHMYKAYIYSYQKSL